MTDRDLTNCDITQVWNCEHAFQNVCPKTWQDLERTETNGVRRCGVCNENVTYCATPEQFVHLGNAGQCVAIPDGHSPATLETMILGRPTPRETRELKERQSQIAAWWTTALECDPSFAPEAMAAIGRAIDLRNQPAPELSLEDREHLTRLRDAIVNGPEALYLHLRVRPSGKRDNEQNIFRRMRSHFSMTFREFKTLANRLEKEYPQ